MVRIPFDSLTLMATAQELRRDFLGGQLQHVSQPSPADLVLTIRSRSANYMLLLSCDANWARAHITSAKRANPPTPPAFCMLCRKYIEGAHVAEIRQRDFDRILDIEFRASGGDSYTLVAELMGKHSNLILVNEGGTILDSAKRITRKISRLREVLPGKTYVPPPPQADRDNPFEIDRSSLQQFLNTLPADREAQSARWMSHFTGISPFLAEEMTLRTQASTAEEAWREIFGAAQKGNWNPVIVRNEKNDTIGAYPLPTVQAPTGSQFKRDSINTALDHYYGSALPRAALDSARHEMETAINRALKSREKQRDSILRSLEESKRAEEFRESGEMLLANLHAIEPESEFVELDDYYSESGGKRRITLDPEKTAKENSESYFRRYRKAKNGADIQREYLERVESDVNALQSALISVQEATDSKAVLAIKSELANANLLRGEKAAAEPAKGSPRTPDFGGKKIRIFHAPEGWDLYVGENSEANDYLTAKVASPNDWWLHVRANASAHVVIRTRNNPTSVPMSVIRRAALLAAQHSASKHSEIVPVDYTLKKFVRRPRGSASGAAIYQNEKTIYVNPKEAREH